MYSRYPILVYSRNPNLVYSRNRNFICTPGVIILYTPGTLIFYPTPGIIILYTPGTLILYPIPGTIILYTPGTLTGTGTGAGYHSWVESTGLSTPIVPVSTWRYKPPGILTRPDLKLLNASSGKVFSPSS